LSDYYRIGKIISAGKNGFVKVQLVPGLTKFLAQLKNVFLDFWDQKKNFYLEEIIDSKNSIFFKFRNFDDTRNISLLIGRDIFVPHKIAGSLSDDNLLLQNLIGFEVFQQNNLVGVVKNVFESPANFVIEISNNQGIEVLIPFVPSLLEKIDMIGKKVFLAPDYGIYDDED